MEVLRSPASAASACTAALQSLHGHADDFDVASVVKLVVGTLRLHASEAALQCAGYVVLDEVARKDDANKAAIIREGGLEVVVAAMDTLRSAADVQTCACSLLRALALDSGNRARIGAAGTTRVVAAAMRAHSGASELQLRGCQVFQPIVYKISNIPMFFAEGGFVEVSRALLDHRGHLGVVKSALDVLYFVVEDVADHVTDDAPLLERLQVGVVGVMAAFPDDAEVQSHSIAVISTLSAGAVEAAAAAGAAPGDSAASFPPWLPAVAGAGALSRLAGAMTAVADNGERMLEAVGLVAMLLSDPRCTDLIRESEGGRALGAARDAMRAALGQAGGGSEAEERWTSDGLDGKFEVLLKDCPDLPDAEHGGGGSDGSGGSGGSGGDGGSGNNGKAGNAGNDGDIDGECKNKADPTRSARTGEGGEQGGAKEGAATGAERGGENKTKTAPPSAPSSAASSNAETKTALVQADPSVSGAATSAVMDTKDTAGATGGAIGGASGAGAGDVERRIAEALASTGPSPGQSASPTAHAALATHGTAGTDKDNTAEGGGDYVAQLAADFERKRVELERSALEDRARVTALEQQLQEAKTTMAAMAATAATAATTATAATAATTAATGSDERLTSGTVDGELSDDQAEVLVLRQQLQSAHAEIEELRSVHVADQDESARRQGRRLESQKTARQVVESLRSTRSELKATQEHCVTLDAVAQELYERLLMAGEEVGVRRRGEREAQSQMSDVLDVLAAEQMMGQQDAPAAFMCASCGALRDAGEAGEGDVGGGNGDGNVGRDVVGRVNAAPLHPEAPMHARDGGEGERGTGGPDGRDVGEYTGAKKATEAGAMLAERDVWAVAQQVFACLCDLGVQAAGGTEDGIPFEIFLQFLNDSGLLGTGMDIDDVSVLMGRLALADAVVEGKTTPIRPGSIGRPPAAVDDLNLEQFCTALAEVSARRALSGDTTLATGGAPIDQRSLLHNLAEDYLTPFLDAYGPNGEDEEGGAGGIGEEEEVDEGDDGPWDDGVGDRGDSGGALRRDADVRRQAWGSRSGYAEKGANVGESNDHSYYRRHGMHDGIDILNQVVLGGSPTRNAPWPQDQDQDRDHQDQDQDQGYDDDAMQGSELRHEGVSGASLLAGLSNGAGRLGATSPLSAGEVERFDRDASYAAQFGAWPVEQEVGREAGRGGGQEAGRGGVNTDPLHRFDAFTGTGGKGDSRRTVGIEEARRGPPVGVDAEDSTEDLDDDGLPPPPPPPGLPPQMEGYIAADAASLPTALDGGGGGRGEGSDRRDGSERTGNEVQDGDRQGAEADVNSQLSDVPSVAWQLAATLVEADDGSGREQQFSPAENAEYMLESLADALRCDATGLVSLKDLHILLQSCNLDNDERACAEVAWWCRADGDGNFRYNTAPLSLHVLNPAHCHIATLPRCHVATLPRCHGVVPSLW